MEKITGFYQKSVKIHCVLLSHELLSTNIYTTHQFTYFIYYLFQHKFKNPKMMKIQHVHQKIHAKQFFIILFKLLSIGDSFKFKVS